MTYIAIVERWLYLARVIDAYSRKIVGWAMGQEHDAELVEAALEMALLQRQPGAGLVHHSDRGSEYTCKSYQDLPHQHEIQISMSGKGDCYDNALMESFWGTLKEECFGKIIFPTRKEAIGNVSGDLDSRLGPPKRGSRSMEVECDTTSLRGVHVPT